MAETGDRGGGVDDILRAVQGQRPPALGEVPVVADIDAQPAIGRREYGIAGVAGLEEEFFPEPRNLRNMVLAVLA